MSDYLTERFRDLTGLEPMGVAMREAGRSKAGISADLASLGVRGWPKESVVAIKEMLGRYGLPDESTRNLLIWRNITALG